MSRFQIVFVILLLAVYGNAWARTDKVVPVLDEQATTRDDPYSIMAKFVVNNENKELGRVWVEVEIDGGYVDADLNRQEVFLKKMVPGLRFDPSTNQVIYQGEGTRPVVCGNFSDGSFMRQAFVEPTGLCKFTIKTEKRPLDDGYYVRQQPYVIVSMIIP